MDNIFCGIEEKRQSSINDCKFVKKIIPYHPCTTEHSERQKLTNTVLPNTAKHNKYCKAQPTLRRIMVQGVKPYPLRSQP